MGYLIDSDWVVDHLADDEEANRLLSWLSEDGIAISIITYIEIYQGVLRSPTLKEAEQKLQAFVDTVSILSISPAVARRCAHIREDLRKQRKEFRRRAFDLLIAATAIEHDLTLLTRNRGDYDDVPNIRFYQPSA
jgi:tRNA(fMet)-specific endonuclease VapC